MALDTAWPWANDTYGLCCLRAYFCAHNLFRARSYVAIPCCARGGDRVPVLGAGGARGANRARVLGAGAGCCGRWPGTGRRRVAGCVRGADWVLAPGAGAGCARSGDTPELLGSNFVSTKLTRNTFLLAGPRESATKGTGKGTGKGLGTDTAHGNSKNSSWNCPASLENNTRMCVCGSPLAVHNPVLSIGVTFASFWLVSIKSNIFIRSTLCFHLLRSTTLSSTRCERGQQTSGKQPDEEQFQLLFLLLPCAVSVPSAFSRFLCACQ